MPIIEIIHTNLYWREACNNFLHSSIGERMPVTIGQMAANQATVVVTGEHLGNDTINLVIYPNKVTTASIKQLDEGTDAINQVLVNVIKSWDVLEDDGVTPLPITTESLEKLGMAIVWQMRMEIIKALRPNL
jgi:hypothetical protein